MKLKWGRERGEESCNGKAFEEKFRMRCKKAMTKGEQHKGSFVGRLYIVMKQWFG